MLPDSNCTYNTKFSLKSTEKPTRYNPSTNRPIKCSVCESVVWSYNNKLHVQEEHGLEASHLFIEISEKEKQMVLKKI